MRGTYVKFVIARDAFVMASVTMGIAGSMCKGHSVATRNLCLLYSAPLGASVSYAIGNWERKMLVMAAFFLSYVEVRKFAECVPK